MVETNVRARKLAMQTRMQLLSVSCNFNLTRRTFAKLRCLIAINRVMTGSGQLTLPRSACTCRCATARPYGMYTVKNRSSSVCVLNEYTSIHVTREVDAWNWRFCFPISISERRWGAFNWDWRCWLAVATLLMATESSIDSNGTR